MKIKIFLVALALFLAFALAACSAGGDNNAPTSLPSSEETVTPLPESDLVPKAEEESAGLVAEFTDIISDLAVHFLDVGQGDSIFIQLPNGQIMLIDGGNSGDEGKIISYMDSNSVTSIDYLVVTHPHADHIGGLPSIINSMDIGELYMPRISHNTQTFERLLTAIENNGLEINTAKAGESVIYLPDLQVDIVAPVKDSYNELNDFSAIIKIVYGNTSFLFMGDAEAAAEGQIAADVSADVLKVGHHGSSASTTQDFLNKVAPTYAVISVGSGNTYGHPADQTLSRLNDANVKVYRTDLQGTIVFTSDGNKITVNTDPTPYQAPPQVPTTSPTVTSEPDNDSVMVWLSATGSKYHSKNNCGNMNPDKARQVTLEEAKRSYEPCKKCNPPK